MHKELIDESASRPEKLWWLSVNKKWILIAVGSIIVTVSFIAICTAKSDSDPPGTPMPRKCGQQTDKSSWPWAVEIFSRNYPSWEHTDALGTLINDRYVLSSAYELNEHEFSHLRILLAETTFVHTVNDSYFEGRVYRDAIKKQFMEFEDLSRTNILLLRMDRPVAFNGRIQPVCLPWVQPQIPQQLSILREVKSQLISSSVHLVGMEHCVAAWFSHLSSDEEDDSSSSGMCAKMSDSNEHCYALRGSPLLGVYRDGGQDRFVQYGNKYHGDCTEGLQLYTNVTENMKWIQEIITSP